MNEGLTDEIDKFDTKILLRHLYVIIQIHNAVITNKQIDTEDYEATIGIEQLEKSFVVDKQTYQLQIWDTAGQERYHSLVRLYFKDIKGILLVFQMDRQDTFDHLKDWLDLFNGSVSPGFTPPVLLVGNKLDLVESNGRIQQDVIDRFKEEYNLKYIETSSKEFVISFPMH